MHRPLFVFLFIFLLFGALSHYVNAVESSITRPVKASSPNCNIRCACMGTPVDQSELSMVKQILSGKTYGLLASGFNCIGMVTSGGMIESNKQVDKMCPSATYDLETQLMIYTGFGANSTSTLALKYLAKISIYNFKQKYDPMEMSNEKAEMYKLFTSPARLSVIGVFEGAYVLFTKCYWNGETAWFVKSPKKTLSIKSKRQILKKVEQAGFNPKDYYAPDLKNCQ